MWRAGRNFVEYWSHLNAIADRPLGSLAESDHAIHP
ncbi:hypothetical protein GZL_07937 [Streptomyces sp. 769]|nr:hypothetical protein GZL_07937 [Streptomyces sp. 769]